VNLELFFGTKTNEDRFEHNVKIACFCYLKKVGCPPAQIGVRQEEMEKMKDVKEICQRHGLTLVSLPTVDMQRPTPGHFYLWH